MKKTASGAGPRRVAVLRRVGIEHYLKYEYCPADLMKKSVASTIDSLTPTRRSPGWRTRWAARRRPRSAHGRFYRNLWNPETQFFQPRDSRGNFLTEFSPEMLTYVDTTGKYTHAYVEGSAWQWRWGVPSDAAELVSLFKSREFFVQDSTVFRPVARRRRAEPERLLLAREPTRPLCRLSLQSCRPSRPDAEVGPVGPGNEVRGS